MSLRYLVIALTLATSVANACPPGPCLKYRHIQRVRQQATARTYIRAVIARPPTRPADVGGFLTSATWQPVPEPLPPNMLPALALRFVDARRVVPVNRPDERQVLVRRIERDGTTMMVDVDGVVFELAACRDLYRHWTSCLTERRDRSFDELDHRPVERQFAQPP